MAASDREGELQLDVTRTNTGGHRIDAGGTIPVEAVTLDSLVARGVLDPERVGLLWIDAQGHEGAVLDGASTLVGAGVPAVVAIRPGKGGVDGARPWDVGPETRASVLARLGASYTDAVELRKHSRAGRRVHPIAELDRLVDSFANCQDLLFVRR